MFLKSDLVEIKQKTTMSTRRTKDKIPQDNIFSSDAFRNLEELKSKQILIKQFKR